MSTTDQAFWRKINSKSLEDLINKDLRMDIKQDKKLDSQKEWLKDLIETINLIFKLDFETDGD